MSDGRVEIPNGYGYRGDEEPRYGTAVSYRSLGFFLESRDAPNLANEMARHFQNLSDLQQTSAAVGMSGNFHRMLERFRKTLHFFQECLEEANRGDILAEKLLESLKPINALKNQWFVVLEHERRIHQNTSDNIETIRIDNSTDGATLDSDTDNNNSHEYFINRKVRVSKCEMKVTKSTAGRVNPSTLKSNPRSSFVPSNEVFTSPRYESASTLIRMRQMDLCRSESFRYHKASKSSDTIDDDNNTYTIEDIALHRDFGPLPKRARSDSSDDAATERETGRGITAGWRIDRHAKHDELRHHTKKYVRERRTNVPLA